MSITGGNVPDATPWSGFVKQLIEEQEKCSSRRLTEMARARAWTSNSFPQSLVFWMYQWLRAVALVVLTMLSLPLLLVLVPLLALLYFTWARKPWAR